MKSFFDKSSLNAGTDSAGSNLLKNGSAVYSELVRFDPPRLAFLNSFIEELHGMLLVSSCHVAPDSDRTVCVHRVPLIGPLLKPWRAVDEGSLSQQVVPLPDNRTLTPEFFSSVIYFADNHGFVMGVLDSLASYGYRVSVPDSGITVRVKATRTSFSLVTDWFNLTVKVGGALRLSPSHVRIFFRVMDFLDCGYTFTAGSPEGTDAWQKEQRIVDRLEHFQEVYQGSGFYTASRFGADGKLVQWFHDGTYLYATGQTRRTSSLDDFLAKHPNADLVRTDPGAFIRPAD